MTVTDDYARDHLTALIVRAEQGESFTINAEGIAKAVLIGYDDWCELREARAELMDEIGSGERGE